MTPTGLEHLSENTGKTGSGDSEAAAVAHPVAHSPDAGPQTEAQASDAALTELIADMANWSEDQRAAAMRHLRAISGGINR